MPVYRTDRTEATEDLRLENPRLDALRRWLFASDRNDITGMKRATRTLRDCGLSVCSCSPPARQGGAL